MSGGGLSVRGRGIAFACLAYGAWGFLPLYWRALSSLPALEILFQRVLWAFVFYGLVLWWRRQPSLLRSGSWGSRGRLVGSGALLLLNWGTYVYAVNTERVVEASLGYFITPLLSIALGLVVLREPLRALRLAAVALAAGGVGVLWWEAGRLPWISLVLAVSFSLYGLLRKLHPQESFAAAHFEALAMLPVMALVFLVGPPDGSRLSLDHPLTLWLLLVLSGPVTGLPLIWFNEAAVRLPLSLLGFFQYLSPTLQFLIGVGVYGEPLGTVRLAGFACIWLGIGLALLDGIPRPGAAAAGR